MNTGPELHRLTQAVAARMEFTEDDIVNAQLDLASEYLDKLEATDWLSYTECQLLRTLPGFWAWWRMVWANRDRVILDKLPALAVADMRKHGRDVVEIYKAYHGPAAWGEMYPNDMLLAELEAAKREQEQAFRTLKTLFNNHSNPF